MHGISSRRLARVANILMKSNLINELDPTTLRALTISKNNTGTFGRSLVISQEEMGTKNKENKSRKLFPKCKLRDRRGGEQGKNCREVVKGFRG